jgi:hypothetical protein
MSLPALSTQSTEAMEQGATGAAAGEGTATTSASFDNDNYEEFFTAPSTPRGAQHSSSSAAFAPQSGTDDNGTQATRRLLRPRSGVGRFLPRPSRVNAPRALRRAIPCMRLPMSPPDSTATSVSEAMRRQQQPRTNGELRARTTRTTSHDLQSVANKLQSHVTRADCNNDRGGEQTGDADDDKNDKERDTTNELLQQQQQQSSSTAATIGTDTSASSLGPADRRPLQAAAARRRVPVPVAPVPTGDQEWQCMSVCARTLMSLMWNSEFAATERYIAEQTLAAETTLASHAAANNATATTATQALATRLVISHGSGFYSFMTAVLTFEEEDVDHATKVLGHNEKLIAAMLKETSVVQWKAAQSGGLHHARPVVDHNLNLRKLNLEMMRADTLLLNGVIYLFQGTGSKQEISTVGCCLCSLVSPDTCALMVSVCLLAGSASQTEGRVKAIFVLRWPLHAKQQQQLVAVEQC